MAKRKEAADPFGLSLLDALTNALGGVILLMFIVAATIKGLDEKKLNLDPEDEQGREYTVRKFKRTKKDLSKPQILLIQLEIEADVPIQPFLSPEGKTKGCSIAKSGIDNEWMIVRNETATDDWQVMVSPSDLAKIKSIGVYVTYDQKVPCAQRTIKIDNVNLIKVMETPRESPQITISGNEPCKL